MSRSPRILPETMEHFLARQVGQVQVEKNEIGLLGPRGGETPLTVGRVKQADAGSPLEHTFHEAHVRAVVFDVQHHAPRVRTRQIASSVRAGSAASVQRLRRFSQRQLDPERGAAIDHALDAERAAHRFGQAARQRQTETGAFDRRLLRAETLERLEQQLQLCVGDARRRCRSPSMPEAAAVDGVEPDRHGAAGRGCTSRRSTAGSAGSD